MDTIDIQQIIDYAKCPMYYKYKYIDVDKKTNYVNIFEKYDKSIHRVIYNSLIRKQENHIIRLDDIKRIWGVEWIKDKRKSKIVFAERKTYKDLYNERRKKGLLGLLHFREVFNKTEAFPFLINKEYKITINNSFILTGNIELVQKNIDGTIECMLFKTNEYTNNKVNKNYDLKLIGNAVALSNMLETQHNEKIKYIIFHIDKKTQYEIPINDINYKIFINNVSNIKKAIDNNIFYFVPEEKCYNCVYSHVCGYQQKLINVL